MLGIRPEDLDENPREGAPEISLRVDVVEILGADQYLYGKVGEDDVTARVDPHFAAQPGDTVRLRINLARIHLFDAESGVSLTSEVEPVAA